MSKKNQKYDFYGSWLVIVFILIAMVMMVNYFNSTDAQKPKEEPAAPKAETVAEPELEPLPEKLPETTEETTAPIAPPPTINSKQEAQWGNTPDFAAEMVDGSRFVLSSLTGKVILLNFWATWCPHCKHEIDTLQQLKHKYNSQGLEIVGVAFERNTKNLPAYINKHGINYTIVLGTNDIAMKFPDIQGIPTTILIDGNGNIAAKYVGGMDVNRVESVIQQLLKGLKGHTDL